VPEDGLRPRVDRFHHRGLIHDAEGRDNATGFDNDHGNDTAIDFGTAPGMGHVRHSDNADAIVYDFGIAPASATTQTTLTPSATALATTTSSLTSPATPTHRQRHRLRP
jgi:hypothetical protein